MPCTSACILRLNIDPLCSFMVDLNEEFNNGYTRFSLAACRELTGRRRSLPHATQRAQMPSERSCGSSKRTRLGEQVLVFFFTAATRDPGLRVGVVFKFVYITHSYTCTCIWLLCCWLLLHNLISVFSVKTWIPSSQYDSRCNLKTDLRLWP